MGLQLSHWPLTPQRMAHVSHYTFHSIHLAHLDYLNYEIYVTIDNIQR